MQTSKEAREARRRRILERGSDRLAYITGDASKQQALRTSPSSPSITLQTPDVQFESDCQVQDNILDSQQPFPDSQPSQGFSETPDVVPASALRGRVLEKSTVTAASAMGSSNTNSSQSKKVKKTHPGYVKNIIQGIDGSETLRALVAVVVAVFVVAESVLSCCSDPWGKTLSLILPSWPLGLVCITDLTIVIGAYLICSQIESSHKDLSGPSSQAEGLQENLDKMSKALDVVEQFEDVLNLGLLCKKAAGAISLDCSIYTVVLVCGLSICNYLFSCSRIC